MIAIRNKETNVVWDLFADSTPFKLTQRGLFCKDKSRNGPVTSREWEAIEATPPSHFEQNALTYIGGVWAVVDQGAVDSGVQVASTKARAEAKATLIQWVNDFLEPFTNAYPAAEVLTWALQSDYARAVSDGDASTRADAFIGKLAKARGLSSADMAAKIIKKADKYEAAVQATAALRSATMAAIDAAPVDQIPTILATAQAQAMTKAREIGLIE